MILHRQNMLGMSYELMSSMSRSDQTEIVLIGKCKSIVVNHPIEQLNQAWSNWMNGELIQKAFAFLSVDEREFLMTGITPTEWDELFSDEDEHDL